MSTNANILVQEKFVSAVFAGDGDTIRSLADAEFELHEGTGLPFAGVYRGAEGFLKFLTIFGETFDIERLEPVRSFASADPDWLAFEFDLKGVLRSTGAVFESSLIEVWHFREGKVLSIKAHYFNSPLHG